MGDDMKRTLLVGGVATTLDVPMSAKELGLLKASADAVRAVATSLRL